MQKTKLFACQKTQKEANVDTSGVRTMRMLAAAHKETRRRYVVPHALYEVETQAKLKSTALDHSAIVSYEALTSSTHQIIYIE
jgi:hypothetical protein